MLIPTAPTTTTSGPVGPPMAVIPSTRDRGCQPPADGGIGARTPGCGTRCRGCARGAPTAFSDSCRWRGTIRVATEADLPALQDIESASGRAFTDLGLTPVGEDPPRRSTRREFRVRRPSVGLGRQGPLNCLIVEIRFAPLGPDLHDPSRNGPSECPQPAARRTPGPALTTISLATTWWPSAQRSSARTSPPQSRCRSSTGGPAGSAA